MQAVSALPSRHAGHGAGFSALRTLRAFGARIRRWRERSVTRKALRQLDARTLQDVGITWARALTEARKPFWKA